MGFLEKPRCFFCVAARSASMISLRKIITFTKRTQCAPGTGRGLSEQLGQQFVIENRPGAAGNLGTEFVARAAPDGYTLLTVVAPNAINATLYDNLNFNFIHDIAPVGGIGRVPFVVAAAPALPAKTIAEFIAYAKGNPDKVNMVTGGNGTATDVFGELFEIMTGVSLVKVPYRSDYMADLISGLTQSQSWVQGRTALGE